MEPRPHRLRRVPQVDEDAVANWLERVRERFPDAIVYLFGSRARGHAWPDSDYDFCVISGGFEGLKPWERAEQLTALWDPEKAIEVVTYTPSEWDRVKDWTFPSTIRTEGVRLLPDRAEAGAAPPTRAPHGDR